MAKTQASWRPNAEVVSPFTPLWSEHPVPGMGAPDAMLNPGEKVRLLRNHLGFSKVQLSDLRAGWVAYGTVLRQ